jgi:hypothetical protein
MSASGTQPVSDRSSWQLLHVEVEAVFENLADNSFHRRAVSREPRTTVPLWPTVSTSLKAGRFQRSTKLRHGDLVLRAGIDAAQQRHVLGAGRHGRRRDRDMELSRTVPRVLTTWPPQAGATSRSAQIRLTRSRNPGDSGIERQHSNHAKLLSKIKTLDVLAHTTVPSSLVYR